MHIFNTKPRLSYLFKCLFSLQCFKGHNFTVDIFKNEEKETHPCPQKRFKYLFCSEGLLEMTVFEETSNGKDIASGVHQDKEEDPGQI